MTQGGCPSRCDRATVAAKLVAKLTAKLHRGLRSRPSRWPSSRPSSWPSWAWSSRWMTTLTSPEPGWRNRAGGTGLAEPGAARFAPSRTLRQRRRQGLNGQKCPKCTDQRRALRFPLRHPLRFALRVAVHAGNELRRTGNGSPFPIADFSAREPGSGTSPGR